MKPLCGRPFPADPARRCDRKQGHMASEHEATWELTDHVFLTVRWHVLDARPEIIEAHAAEWAEQQQRDLADPSRCVGCAGQSRDKADHLPQCSFLGGKA